MVALTPSSTGLSGIHECGNPYRWVEIPRLVFNATKTKVVTKGLEWAIWCDHCQIGGHPAIPIGESSG